MQQSINAGIKKHIGNHPNLLVCQGCGREYGSLSLSIHQPSCQKKWEIEQSKVPKSKRRAFPSSPTSPTSANSSPDTPEFGTPLGGNNQYNQEAMDSYLDSGRENCPNCGRGFAHGRLEVHLRSCTPGGFFAKNAKR